MNRIVIAALLSITLIESVFPQISHRSSGSADNPSNSASGRVDALFAPWSKGDTPGAAVIIIQNGKVLLKKGYGLANLQTKAPITTDTAFRLASLTKQFTAMAVMMLAERGKLKYEDPLSKFFPEFPTYAEKITIRHLLNHLAGFPEYEDLFIKSGKIDKDWPRSASTKPSAFEPSSKDALAILEQVKSPDFGPGEKFRYSNSGYVILAQIVEKVSGQSFRQFLEQNTFAPLGMKRSFVNDETRPRVSNLATSYTLKDGVYHDIDYTPVNAIYGEDNVYSTIEDLYKWDQALYTEKLVKASTLKEAFSPGRLNDGSLTSYGFAWGVSTFLGLESVAHSGSWLGFRTRIVRFPAQRFTVIILSNVAELEPNLLASKISKTYLADKLTFPVAKHLEPKLLEEYVGRYEFSPRVIAEVSLESRELWLKTPGQEKIRLVAESEDSFFPEGLEEMRLTFNRDEKKKVIVLSVRGGGIARKLP